MNIVFYTDKTAFSNSNDLIAFVLREKLKIKDFKIERSENGKPFLVFPNGKTPPFISVSHTSEKYFLAVCDKNVGIDGEISDRTVEYLPIIAKFPLPEREEITSNSDFLRHWTAKESVVKWLGGSLSKDLKKLSFVQNKMTLNGLDLPLFLFHKEIVGHILCVCLEEEREFQFLSI